MSSTTIWIVAGFAAILAALLLFSSGEPETSVDSAVAQQGLVAVEDETLRLAHAAQPPVVDAGADVTVGEREAVQLDGIGYDPVGGSLVSYHWTAVGGLGFFSNAHVPDPIYTAPSACDCEDAAVLTLTVTNAAGIGTSDQLVVYVRDPLACPAEQHTASGTFETSLEIDPCAPYEMDEPCPPKPVVPCESPCVAEVVPVGGCAEVSVPCPCEEGCGPMWGSSWPFGPKPVQPSDRPKPRIDRHYPAHIAEEMAFQLRGWIINPGCSSVCFAWSASKGWIEGADTLEPIYHAPPSDRTGGERVTITLSIYDGFGERSYDQIRLRIDNLDGNSPNS